MTRFPRARPTKGQKRTRPLVRVDSHVFLNAGQVNHKGEGICDMCGHLRSHRVHDITVPPGTFEVADRIMGEG